MTGGRIYTTKERISSVKEESRSNQVALKGLLYHIGIESELRNVE